MALHKSKTSCLTSRGQHFGNVWNVYSYKTKKHYSLASDIELCYWLLFLEFDRSVKTFELHPLPRIGFEPRPWKLAFTAELILRDGCLEWHLLSTPASLEKNKVIIEAERLAANNCAKVKVFTENDIIPLKYKVVPLLKVASCLSAGKSCALPFSLFHDVRSFTRNSGSGAVGDIVREFGDYDISMILYVIAKMFADGDLHVEIAPIFFAHETRWQFL